MKFVSLKREKKVQGLLFILPGFIFHFILIVLPATSLIYYGFTNWSGINVPEFVGFANYYRAFFEDKDFFYALLNNLKWIVFFLTVPIITGFIIALGVIKMKRGQMIMRAMFFMPYVVGSVVVGRIFAYLYSPYIGIAAIFKKLGIESLANFAPLGNTNLALWAVAFADFWHWWGFVMILFIAALHQVDDTLYEAASIEGANAFQKLFYITLPSIMPTLVTIFMITIIGSFLTFDYVWVMTKGGPGGTTEIAASWIYKKAFNAYEAGYSSSLSLIIVSICILVYFIFQMIQSRLRKRGSEI